MTETRARSALNDVAFRVVPTRRFVNVHPRVRFPLRPGDRILVAAGDEIPAGSAIAERQRDSHVEEGPSATGASGTDAPLRPGDWWPGDGHEAPSGRGQRRSIRTHAGELLHPAGARWRIAAGQHVDAIESPAAGVVCEAVPGCVVEVELRGIGLPGAFATGVSSRGRLERVAGQVGLRSALDVGRAGAVLIVDGRVDSEAIIRARAMGVRGVVVPGLAGKDLRDLAASEARQRASLQPLAPFAVVVLESSSRQSIPGPVATLLRTLEGREVALLVDPPLLVFDPPPETPLPPVAGWVRVRAGDLAGREGRWLRPLGIRRFPAGVQLEAAAVVLDDGHVAAVPIADLERFV